MKEKQKTARFQSQQAISMAEKQQIMDLFYAHPGVEFVHVGLNFVEVDYQSAQLSPAGLKEVLSAAVPGFKTAAGQKKKSLLGKVFSGLKKLQPEGYSEVKQNKKSCCD